MQGMGRFLHRFPTSRPGRCALTLAITLFLPPPVIADGKMFPPKAYPAEIKIPDQAAVLIWSNGVERLVIETRFVGEGTNFAWVVPLPVQPVIEPATTGLFTTLRFRFQPEVRHAVAPVWGVTLLLGAVVWLLITVRAGSPVADADAVACILAGVGIVGAAGETGFWVIAGLFLSVVTYLTTVAVRRGTNPVYTVLVTTGMVGLLVALLLPALGTAGTKGGNAGDGNGVEVLACETVGVYETTTVAARDPTALPRWLAENDFVLTPGSQPVIEQYAREGWVFVAAKIRREHVTAGVSAAHPLSFTFPAERPVYPLRLTGVGNEKVTVELYVFGPEPAVCPGFELEECHVPQWPDESNLRRVRSDPAQMRHPLLKQWASGSAVVTKLSGTLGPREMVQDAVVSWEAFQARRSTVYSHRGALMTGLNFGVPLFCVFALAAGALSRLRNQPLASVARPLLWGAGLGLAVFVVIYAALPKIEVKFEKRYGWFMSEKTLELLARWTEDLLEVDGPVDVAAVRNAFQQIPDEDRQARFRNEVMGGLIIEEDSPGNFTLRETPVGVEFVAHDVMGGENVVRILVR